MRYRAAIALFVVPALWAQRPVVFQDGDFATGWTEYRFSEKAPPGTTARATRQASGGNPGAFHRIDIELPGGEESGSVTQALVLINETATYSPVRQGPVTRLIYREDSKNFGSGGAPGDGQSTGLAIRQNGKIWVVRSLKTLKPANWSKVTSADLAQSAQAFAQLGTPGPFFNTSAPAPDFSASGADLQFGFWRGLELTGSSGSGGGGGYTPGGYSKSGPGATAALSASIGIDNWTVEIENLRAVDDRIDKSVDGTGRLSIPVSAIAANDSFPVGSTIRLDSTGSRGVASLDDPTRILYVPSIPGTGTDIVSYSIVTPLGLVSNSATITIVYRPNGFACSVQPRNTFCLDPFQPCSVRKVTVTDNGVPVPGATVVVEAAAYTTDLTGSARLDSLSRLPLFTANVWRPWKDIANPPDAVCDGGTITLADLAGAFFRCPSTLIFLFDNRAERSMPDTLRRLRDSRLAASPTGRRWTQQYYAFADEIKALLVRDPQLTKSLAAELLEHRELAARIAGGESVTVPAEVLERASATATRIAAKASPGLQTAIAEFQRDLRDPVALAALGLRSTPPARPTRGPVPLLASLPLHFEPNRGQAAHDVAFTARGSHDRLDITRAGPRISLGSEGSISIRLAPAAAPVVADSAPGGHSNYLRGSNPRQWALGVPHYSRLRQRGIHPGVDLVYYGTDGRLEFDFEIAPGADPTPIRLRVEGASRLETDSHGGLVLRQGAATATLKKPAVFQEKAGRREPVDARYVLRGNEVEFALGPRDPAARLVIDPVLTYAGYLGGSGADSALAVAVDTQGNTYLTGAGGSGTQSDAFLTKLNAAGTAIVYTTNFGGSSDDIGLGIALDAQGAAYVTGATRSADFPVTQALQRTFGGAGKLFGTDAFVLKVDPAGRVAYSTYLGGSGDDAARGIAIDRSGNAYVAGATASPNFPLSSAAYATHRGGDSIGTDGFVAKINATGTALIYSTLLGGRGDDFVTAIALDSFGAVHLTGGTASDDFPSVNPLQRTPGGEMDAFAASLNPAGTALTYSTFLGGTSFDLGLAIALDARGGPHVGGVTGSLDSFPLFKAAQSTPGSPGGVGMDSFLTRLEPGGGRFVYSTLLGGNGADAIVGLAVDDTGSVYAAGFTASTGLASGPAPQMARAGGTDGLLAKLTPAGAIEYRGYLGGSGADALAGIAADGRRGVVLAGSSSSFDGPATSDALLAAPKGTSAVMLARLAPGDGAPLIRAVSNASLDGGNGIAPDSRASLTGLGGILAEGASIRITDATGREFEAEIAATSTGRIDFLVPASAGIGVATVALLRDGQSAASTRIVITRTAPAIYTESGDGAGLASGFAEESGGERFLVVVTTGARAAETRAAVIGGITVPVVSIEPYAGNPGLDLARIGPVPPELAAKAESTLTITADGKRSNAVTVKLR